MYPPFNPSSLGYQLKNIPIVRLTPLDSYCAFSLTPLDTYVNSILQIFNSTEDIFLYQLDTFSGIDYDENEIQEIDFRNSRMKQRR